MRQRLPWVVFAAAASMAVAGCQPVTGPPPAPTSVQRTPDDPAAPQTGPVVFSIDAPIRRHL